MGPFHRATMPHSKEYASCSCLKKACIIFQNPTHLSYWPYEEGRARAFSQRECLMKRSQQPDIRLFGLRRIGHQSFRPGFAIFVYFIRNTRLDRLHRNDPWLLPTPIRLHPQSYRTLRETINVVPNIQECICKQTQAPADIIYKSPGK